MSIAGDCAVEAHARVQAMEVMRQPSTSAYLQMTDLYEWRTDKIEFLFELVPSVGRTCFVIFNRRGHDM